MNMFRRVKEYVKEVLRPYFLTYAFAEPFRLAETSDLGRSFSSAKSSAKSLQFLPYLCT